MSRIDKIYDKLEAIDCVSKVKYYPHYEEYAVNLHLGSVEYGLNSELYDFIVSENIVIVDFGSIRVEEESGKGEIRLYLQFR